MTSRRSRRRQERAERQRNVLLLIGLGEFIVAVLAVVLFLALRNTGPTPAASSDRLPRANRVSATGLDPTAGKDICALFPKRTGTETQPPALVIDTSKDYSSWIVTDKGTVALDLFANIAPQTVNSFMFLACSGFYDGLTFHRVLPNFMAQGGDPTGTGMGGPGYTIPDEFGLSDLTFDKPGLLSMARTNQPNSAGSQFFITTAPAHQLDGSFTIFGQVASGQEVVNSLTLRDPEANPNAPPGDKMQQVIVRQMGQ